MYDWYIIRKCYLFIFLLNCNNCVLYLILYWIENNIKNFMFYIFCAGNYLIYDIIDYYTNKNTLRLICIIGKKRLYVYVAVFACHDFM